MIDTKTRSDFSWFF